jgi:hypothetical protein
VARGLHKEDSSLLGTALREPTQEERDAADALFTEISVKYTTSYRTNGTVTLSANRFQDVHDVAEAALENTQAVMNDLCTPSIPDGFYFEWRASSLRALAVAAEARDLVYPNLQTQEV